MPRKPTIQQARGEKQAAKVLEPTMSVRVPADLRDWVGIHAIQTHTTVKEILTRLLHGYRERMTRGAV
jgi:RNA polymerase-interacting CarD/CdnL/TRCF family regulator